VVFPVTEHHNLFPIWVPNGAWVPGFDRFIAPFPRYHEDFEDVVKVMRFINPVLVDLWKFSDLAHEVFRNDVIHSRYAPACRHESSVFLDAEGSYAEGPLDFRFEHPLAVELKHCLDSFQVGVSVRFLHVLIPSRIAYVQVSDRSRGSKGLDFVAQEYGTMRLLGQEQFNIHWLNS
jgi:hypothetical protein